MPHNVSEGTDHTAFLGRYAGKAGKDAHPARAEAAILTICPAACTARRLQDGSSDSGSREVQPAGKRCTWQGLQGRERLEHTGGLLYPLVALP